MALTERVRAGMDAVELATELLQRARLTDPDAGLWEAADLQWWWRKPRRSDSIDQHFWTDAVGPVGAVILTDWGNRWSCDPIVVPGAEAIPTAAVWQRALDAIHALRLDTVEVFVPEDDEALRSLATAAGWVSTTERSGITWMAADARPDPGTLPGGFQIVDRSRSIGMHPMIPRNGQLVEARLRQCSLYDPELDLAVVTRDGRTAAYALFWIDPVTRVGLIEPMRVEDEFQRRGLGYCLLTAGVDRLARRGARRLKVGYSGEIARRLYLGAGFVLGATATMYRRIDPTATRR